jgi:hypothetical protein
MTRSTVADARAICSAAVRRDAVGIGAPIDVPEGVADGVDALANQCVAPAEQLSADATDQPTAADDEVGA